MGGYAAATHAAATRRAQVALRSRQDPPDGVRRVGVVRGWLRAGPDRRGGAGPECLLGDSRDVLGAFRRRRAFRADVPIGVGVALEYGAVPILEVRHIFRQHHRAPAAGLSRPRDATQAWIDLSGSR